MVLALYEIFKVHIAKLVEFGFQVFKEYQMKFFSLTLMYRAKDYTYQTSVKCCCNMKGYGNKDESSEFGRFSTVGVRVG